MVVREFGFEPVILTGPSVNLEYATNVYLDTQNRRLYLIRPEQPEHSTNNSYLPRDFKKNQKNWPNVN